MTPIDAPHAENTSPEVYREYLHALARQQIDDRFAGRVDLSGVVQKTLLEAFLIGNEWKTWEELRRKAWLHRALTRNLIDETRHATAGKRDIGRECEAGATAIDSGHGLQDWLAAGHSSPSERAMRNEHLVRLTAALGQLPPEQRQVIELHHLHGLTIAETAEAMGKSAQSVVGLLYRGLIALRELVPE
jgi:RNA polymerase sigma-70 factor (subfamily 1)